MELTINNLEKCFYKASQHDKKYVGVLIHMDDFSKDEIIINENANFDSKFDYYKKVYDENLNHRHAKGIKIVGFTYGNSFKDIENDLIENEKKLENLNFGLAVEAVKKGFKIARQGWNGKGMWLMLVKTPPTAAMHVDGDCYGFLPYIQMKTVDDKMVPWLASQTDILAEDWQIVK